MNGSPIFKEINGLRSLGLGRFGLVDQDLTPIVQFALVPMGPVEQMHLARGRIGGQSRRNRFIMRSSLVSSGFRNFPLGMCHCNLFIR